MPKEEALYRENQHTQSQVAKGGLGPQQFDSEPSTRMSKFYVTDLSMYHGCTTSVFLLLMKAHSLLVGEEWAS